MVPLLLGAAAIWGINNVAEAESNVNAANRINKEAAELAKKANDKVSSTHDKMMDALGVLGKNKQKIWAYIGDTSDMLERVTQKLRLDRDTKSLRELEEAGIYENILQEMHTLSEQAHSICDLGHAGKMDNCENENAVCVFGALGAAAAGFGVVAMPAMLLYSFMKSDEAEAAYYSAKTRMDEARVYAERCNNMCALFTAITKRGEQINRLMSRLHDDYFSSAVDALSDVQSKYGVNYRKYSNESKMTMFYTFQLAQTMKTLADTSMFQEDGALNPDVDASMEIGQKTLALLSQK